MVLIETANTTTTMSIKNQEARIIQLPHVNVDVSNCQTREWASAPAALTCATLCGLAAIGLSLTLAHSQP